MQRRITAFKIRMRTALYRILLAALLVVPLLSPTTGSGQVGEVPGYAGVGIFELPALVEAQSAALAPARTGDMARARTALEPLLKRYPRAGQLHLADAVLAAALGEDAAARTALQRAAELGTPGLGKAIAAPPLDRLAAEIGLTAPPPPPDPVLPEPALVQGGTARVGPENTGWDTGTARARADFQFPPILETHRFMDKATPGTPEAELQRLVSRGFAAGNAGDLYDNRDGGHSRLPRGKRVQLTHVEYGVEAQAAGLHYGLNTGILFNRPTFGNSSTALTGHLGRSQPRHALTTPNGAQRLWQLYAHNHIYVFPEAGDHEPRRGDLFPAATPYMLISQGMSGSDLPLLHAVQVILAAFPPDVKTRLIEERLIAPMVQQIFRQSLMGAPDYLSAEAHSLVVRGTDIDLAAMIRHAQALKPDRIPPRVELRLVREPPPDVTIFADGLNEVLFDTPAAVARLWRGAGGVRTYELEARAKDPNGRALRFHWRVMRGDADRIRIEPLDKDGRRIHLTLPWHSSAPVPGQPDIQSPRVDIAVFADNGAEISAPAFFSMLYPAHQERVHDATDRILRIDHLGHPRAYADPLLWPKRNWSDTFLHDADRQIIGWTRRRANGQTASFSTHGLEILERDAAGRPGLAARVRYPLSRNKAGGLFVTETRQPNLFRYEYADAADRIGRPVPLLSGD